MYLFTWGWWTDLKCAVLGGLSLKKVSFLSAPQVTLNSAVVFDGNTRASGPRSCKSFISHRPIGYLWNFKEKEAFPSFTNWQGKSFESSAPTLGPFYFSGCFIVNSMFIYKLEIKMNNFTRKTQEERWFGPLSIHQLSIEFWTFAFSSKCIFVTHCLLEFINQKSLSQVASVLKFFPPKSKVCVLVCLVNTWRATFCSCECKITFITWRLCIRGSTTGEKQVGQRKKRTKGNSIGKRTENFFYNQHFVSMVNMATVLTQNEIHNENLGRILQWKSEIFHLALPVKF